MRLDQMTLSKVVEGSPTTFSKLLQDILFWNHCLSDSYKQQIYSEECI